MLNEVKKEVERITGKSVKIVNVTKDNSLKLTGLTIRGDNEICAPTIYLDGWADNLTVGEIAGRVVEMYEGTPHLDIGTDDILNRQQILDTVKYRLLNSEKNGFRKAFVPHRDFLDLTVFYRCEANVGIENATVLVDNEIMRHFEISQAELEKAAADNFKKEELKCESMADVMSRIMGIDIPAETQFPMFILSNEKGCYGAQALMDSALLGKLSESINDDLVLLPSSVHEVIVIPKSFCGSDVKLLRSMVAEINGAEVSPEEQLGESVYLWKRQKKELRIM